LSMMFPRVLTSALVMLAAVLPSPATASDAATAGRVNFVKRTGPEFDRFTRNPTAQFSEWMRAKFWRAEVFTPYWDAKNDWYDNGWVYQDLYAIYTDRVHHPEWILKDAGGNRLYIPWGCENGSCPQYAADVGSPAYRAWFIDNLKQAMSKGYRGIWLDDVNLERRVGNGSGKEVAPIDPRTGAPMSQETWRRYVAEFVEEIRIALPGAEILHNSIWFAVHGPRDRDPYVKRQIAAADYINIERGVNDDGLTGGDGEWSLNAVLGYVDRVHDAGKGVVLDAFDSSAQGREYNLAAYYLISTGNDGVGLTAMTPENWWSAYDDDLGTPQGDRTEWQGLLRRDFANGMVLVNEPGAPRRTVELPGTFVDTSGRAVTSVTLDAKSGAVLRGEGAVKAPAAAEPKADTASNDATTRAITETILAPLIPATTDGVPTIGEKPARTVLVRGKVKPVAGGGQVKVKIKRKVRGKKGKRRFRLYRIKRMRVGSSGRFRAVVGKLKGGRYRVYAAYTGSHEARRSRSKGRRLVVRKGRHQRRHD
jgi:Hypothetical glycosyl hydrolase family 15